MLFVRAHACVKKTRSYEALGFNLDGTGEVNKSLAPLSKHCTNTYTNNCVEAQGFGFADLLKRVPEALQRQTCSWPLGDPDRWCGL